MNGFLGQVRDAIGSEDGDRLAALLDGAAPVSRVLSEADCRAVGTVHAGWVAEHAGCQYYSGEARMFDAYGHQKALLKKFRIAFRDARSWILPPLYGIVDRLCELSHLADAQRDAALRGGASLQQQPASTAGDLINQLQATQRFCIMDRSRDMRLSKKIGVLFVVNKMFRAYFAMGEVMGAADLNKPTGVFRSMPDMTHFPPSQTAPCNYYRGRLYLTGDRLLKAEDALQRSFLEIPPSSIHNRRLVLRYLVPVRLLLGSLPRQALLQKYGLPHFAEIAEATRTGNLGGLDAALNRHQLQLIRRGTLLFLRKLRTAALRNLLKRVWLLGGKTNVIALSRLKDVLAWAWASGGDGGDGGGGGGGSQAVAADEIDVAQVACTVGNLIASGYVKGYIAIAMGKLVLSKKNPFPDFCKVARKQAGILDRR